MLKLVDIIEDDLNKLFLYETEDGYTIEGVFYRGNTLCISSQVGCPIGCVFCASGSKGFFRNLNTNELLMQYKLAQKILRGKITNIAIAGIGEPLLNFENMKNALAIFKNDNLKVTISTTAYPLKNFEKLFELNHNGVTISFHAGLQKTRKKIIPVSEDLEKIKSILIKKLLPLSSRQRKKYQLGYLLIDSLNDDKENLKAFAEFASSLKLQVQLMMLNKVEGKPYKPVSEEKYIEIFKFLKSYGLIVTLSNRYRINKLGGCGTLCVNRWKNQVQ